MGRMLEQEPLLPNSRSQQNTASGKGALPSRALGRVLCVPLGLMLLPLLAACGDSASIPNALPVVAGVDSVTCADGVCDVWLRVVDPDMDGVDLEIECLLDGDQPCDLDDAPGTDGRYGLQPDREAPGRDHLLRLIPGVDDSTTIRLRFTPTDLPGDQGLPLTTPGFTLATGL